MREIDMNRTDFAWALDQVLYYGSKVTRSGWNGKGQYVQAAAIEYPSDLPYLVLRNVDNKYVPWVPSQGDLFAKDWSIVEE